MGWTGAVVYPGDPQTRLDGRVLDNDHTSGRCRLVLDCIGNCTAHSEKDKKSRDRSFGIGDRCADHQRGFKKYCSADPALRSGGWFEAFDRTTVRFFLSIRPYLRFIGAAVAMYSFLEKKWGVLLLALAVLISLSRLYVGVHYPIDVIGGAIAGIFAAWAAVKGVKIWDSREKKAHFRKD